MDNDIMIDVVKKVFSTYRPGDMGLDLRGVITTQENIIKMLEANKWHYDKKFCVFCSSHEDGDTLYDMSDWDGGIEFNYIRDIHYCPICGKKLKERERLEF